MESPEAPFSEPAPDTTSGPAESAPSLVRVDRGPAFGRRAELALLVVLLFDLALVATLRAKAMERRADSSALAADEIASTRLDADGRLLYQALVGAVADIADQASESDERESPDRWPTPDELAEWYVPPFSSAALPARLRHLEVEMPARAAAWADYLVRLPATDSPFGAFVLRLIDPAVAPDPFDHPHPHLARRLGGPGGMVRKGDGAERWGVQVWTHPASDAAHAGTALAPGGWLWIVPSELSGTLDGDATGPIDREATGSGAAP